jgi:hypothetical protein
MKPYYLLKDVIQKGIVVVCSDSKHLTNILAALPEYSTDLKWERLRYIQFDSKNRRIVEAENNPDTVIPYNQLLFTIEKTYGDFTVKRNSSPIVTELGSYLSIFFNSRNPYRGSFGLEISCAPTSNCQMFTVSPFMTILSLPSVKERIDILRFLRAEVNGKSPLCLFDVFEGFEKEIRKFNGLVSCTPYTSSNKSKMLLGLVNINVD